MPKASVIVPVYNVKGYVEKCAVSVLAQTEQDLELLLVDDGSTDGSGALCEGIAQTDPRVRVIHQENRGLGGARNTGIEAAGGAWLLFPDSDDWLEPETLARALAAAKGAGADMACFAFRSVDEKGRVLGVFREDMPKDAGLDPHTQKDVLLSSPSACCRLYKAELFQKTGVRYPPRVWYEDIRTTTKLLPNCKKVVYTDYIGYNYLQRPGSIMNSATLARNREIIDAFEDILGWYKEQGLYEAYRAELEYLTLYHVYLTASVRVLRQDPRHPLLEAFRDYTEGYFPHWKGNPYLARMGKKHRLLLWLLGRRQYGAIRAMFKLKG
ncbi:glycosyltransferase family 2 protein [Acutalibacter caecimuris]|uniref:glycosyltransferase family 2 protein n=1 Tax=Acutalibacter caecimuris TaxID=3093657 RepID=UPI002AC8EC1A|nr:glycosyltransferase [Acutalibacter sp. M00118]